MIAVRKQFGTLLSDIHILLRCASSSLTLTPVPSGILYLGFKLAVMGSCICATYRRVVFMLILAALAKRNMVEGVGSTGEFFWVWATLRGNWIELVDRIMSLPLLRRSNLLVAGQLCYAAFRVEPSIRTLMSSFQAVFTSSPGQVSKILIHRDSK